MLIALCVLLWIVSGCASFIYWWLEDFDFSVADIPFALGLGGFFGPFMWVLGKGLSEGWGRGSRVLLKQRKGTQ